MRGGDNRRRVDIRSQLVSGDAGDPLDIKHAEVRHALPLRERLRGDTESISQRLRRAKRSDCSN